MIYKCHICPKVYDILEELLYHIHLEHEGISSERLEESTKARETKKQLSNYVGENLKKIIQSFDCPDCFEMFSDAFKLNEHRKSNHNMQLTKDAEKKIKNLPVYDEKNPPQCEKWLKMDGLLELLYLS